MVSYQPSPRPGRRLAAFAKNCWAVGLRTDYVRVDGELADYVPDFLVRGDDDTVYVVETKARQEPDLERKMDRLRPWCDGASRRAGGADYRFVFVDQEGFERKPHARAPTSAHRP